MTACAGCGWPWKNRLEVSASSPEYGEVKEFVEARCGQESPQIGFNAQDPLEFLGAIGTTDSIRMQVEDAGGAVGSVLPEMTASNTGTY